MTGLLQILAAAPAETPLFADKETRISAGHIRQTANEIAAQIAGRERIYLYTSSASLFAAGLLAASRSGAIVCCPAHMQPQYLREIGADVLVTDAAADFAIRMKIADGKAPPWNEETRDLDLIFYTSGVTGTPKQIAKNIAQLDAEAQTLRTLWGARAGRVFATVSHQHIYGMLFRVFWPVLDGRISEDRAAEYWESLSGKLSPATILISSPAHLTRLPASEVLAGAKPALIFSSGAPLPFAAAQACREMLGSLPIEVLGSTETGGIAWRQQDSSDALWTPLPEVKIGIASDGALNVKSPYAGSADFVATGDVAERMGQKFRLMGRADRVVKIEGKRVSLPRVEEAIRAHAFVADVAAADLPSRKHALGAIVELNAEGRAALAEHGAFRLSRLMRSALAERLEPGERPKHWHFGAIPLNRQGKRTLELLRAHFDETNDPLGRAAVTSLEPEAAEIAIELRPELIWFKGHFPGEPVLPGIAQVHLAAQWAERLWDWKPAGANLSQLKFRRILRPGDTVHLRLARNMERQRLKFAYQLGDIVASEGMIGGGE